jgi:hypothetical protein
MPVRLQHLERSCVALDVAAVRVTITFPGARNDADQRVCVKLEPPELPWPIRFYFLRGDPEPWHNVGFEMGVGPVPRASLEEGIELEPLAPSAVRWFQENFFHYRSRAESELDLRLGVRSRATGNTRESRAALSAQYEQIKDQPGAVRLLSDVWKIPTWTIYRRLHQFEDEGGPPAPKKKSRTRA